MKRLELLFGLVMCFMGVKAQVTVSQSYIFQKYVNTKGALYIPVFTTPTLNGNPANSGGFGISTLDSTLYTEINGVWFKAKTSTTASDTIGFTSNFKNTGTQHNAIINLNPKDTISIDTVLFWNSNKLYKAKLLAVPTSRILTINGISYDLSADRTWTVSTGNTIYSGDGDLASNRNVYLNTHNLLIGDSTFNVGWKNQLTINSGGNMFMHVFDNTTNDHSININKTFMGMEYIQGGAEQALFFQDGTPPFIRDDTYHKGITYYADYSANYTARSLIDKWFGDSHYASITGGAPGGTSGQMQWNNAGAFAGTTAATATATTITLTTPVINGISTGTGVSASNAINTLLLRDGNGNSFSNNFIASTTFTASAGGTTALVPNSTRLQTLTGTLAQTYQLPNANASGMQTGSIFEFNNNSTGAATVTDHGGNVLVVLQTGAYARVTETDASTANGLWDVHTLIPKNSSWSSTGITVGGTTTLNNTATGTAGTDSLMVKHGSLVDAISANYYVPTTTTVAGFPLSANITLAALTATDATLTFSGSYNGSTARTIGLNLGNANTWTATQAISITNTASSGNNYGFTMTDIVNQTSTAAFTDLLISRTNTAVGSGSQLLLDLVVGGVDKFNVNTSGGITSASSVTINGIYTTNQFSTSGSFSSDGLYMYNSATASAGNPSLNSLRTRYMASVWNTTATAAANYAFMKNELRTISGATPTYTMYWGANLSTTTTAGTFTDIMALSNSGDLFGLRSLRSNPIVFASLPASPSEGMLIPVTDSNTATWGATVAGGGANHILAYYDGTNWTVAGK